MCLDDVNDSDGVILRIMSLKSLKIQLSGPQQDKNAVCCVFSSKFFMLKVIVDRRRHK